MSDAPVRVGLFVTCLVDLFRPSVGFAAVKLLDVSWPVTLENIVGNMYPA